MLNIALEAATLATRTETGLATGDGTTTSFSFTLGNVPIKPSTVSITDGTETFTDITEGVLTGSAGGTGTINYVTGEVTLNFNAAPANGASIDATYDAFSKKSGITPEISPTPVTLIFRNRSDQTGEAIIFGSDDGSTWHQVDSFLYNEWVSLDRSVFTYRMIVAACTTPARLVGNPLNNI